MSISVKEINKMLEDFKEAGNSPSLIVILVRYYQGVEIRMVTKKHYFEIQ